MRQIYFCQDKSYRWWLQTKEINRHYVWRRKVMANIGILIGVALLTGVNLVKLSFSSSHAVVWEWTKLAGHRATVFSKCDGRILKCPWFWRSVSQCKEKSALNIAGRTDALRLHNTLAHPHSEELAVERSWFWGRWARERGCFRPQMDWMASSQPWLDEVWINSKWRWTTEPWPQQSMDPKCGPA